MHANDLLQAMVNFGASDLHLKAGSAPGFRIDGNVIPDERFGVLDAAKTSAFARELMSAEQWERFEREKDLDLSYALPNVARFRVNALHQRNTVALVIRQIPDKVPKAENLNLPKACLELASRARGLVLVTGPTGSGKSTTLAALIDYINEHEDGHILTMEDPLEFIHKDKRCFVTQRQIGNDSPTFREALRRSLRQDPDVILIGEMRDLETISLAITAAETGHLVFGTLHTTTAISTVDRVIDVFPPEAQQQVRVQLSATLQGVVSQTLLPKVGGGRVAAYEILIATDGVRALIREGKTTQLLNLIQTGKGVGMCTLEDELFRLCMEGLITVDDAIARSNRAEELQKRLGESRKFGSAAGAAGGAGAAGAAPAAGAARPRTAASR